MIWHTKTSFNINTKIINLKGKPMFTILAIIALNKWSMKICLWNRIGPNIVET